MCGIVGYVGHRHAAGVLLSGLRKLEYRGYDSAGVATVCDDDIDVRRAVGKLDNLQAVLAENPIGGTIGIGHTRWATHGRPSEQNAHPHRSGDVVIIHNGIIENYVALREQLVAEGREIASETDTEVISHLIDREMTNGRDIFEATTAAIVYLEGSFALVSMSSREPGRLVAAKNATPVVIGVGDGENFVASDIPAVLEYTRDVLFLEDGEIADIDRSGIRISTFAGQQVSRKPKRITWDPITAQKGGYKHFLIKEIHEQPQAVIDTMRGRIAQDTGDVLLPELEALGDRLDRIKRATIVACGTAWHAALVGKFILERFARIPTEVDYGSEFRYRDPLVDDETLIIAVSQSGETADTLAPLQQAQDKGALVVSICNVVDSSIARKSDAVIYTHAGPEISVASTKAFTTQLTALYLVGLFLGRRFGGINERLESECIQALVEMPSLMQQTLSCESHVARAARRYASSSDVLYIGRGINYPIALEGALKLKEVSYIHAEGYPAGEMKHGPIALIDDKMPVVVLIPRDEVYSKTLSNLREVESRGGRIIALTDKADDELTSIAETIIEVPTTSTSLMPVLLALPLQLLAYHIAVERGTDIDQPRNLAKSVTVE
ncbi:MAG: glutamine--fructose-6-phosphate transaminase (isomerizing) [Deltaproteobacteria bacterium]